LRQIADEIQKRCDLAGEPAPECIRDFVEEHTGPTRQLALRWARERKMRKNDISCPECGAGFRRLELHSARGERGEYHCACGHVLEVFDGSKVVVYRFDSPTFDSSVKRLMLATTMKFFEPRRFADPDLAARKLTENANGIEAIQDGRIYIERVNDPFLAAGGSGNEFRAGIARAIAQGWPWRHESGTYVKFTDSGAALFA